MEQPTAEEALQALEPLIGEWTIQATWPNGESWPGKVSFEWLDSGAFILQRGSLDHPQAPDNVSVIGCDAANGTYYQLYSDERSVCRVYQLSIGNGEFKLWREGEPFNQRFLGNFSDDGKTITGVWEIVEDSTTYKTDFEMSFRKVAEGRARS